MQIVIRNQAKISNKYIRFIKWKIRKIKDKFKHLLYLKVLISKEGQKPSRYKAVLKLGIKGHDIILTNYSENLTSLWSKSVNDVQRYLRKNKERNRINAFRYKNTG